MVLLSTYPSSFVSAFVTVVWPLHSADHISKKALAAFDTPAKGNLVRLYEMQRGGDKTLVLYELRWERAGTLNNDSVDHAGANKCWTTVSVTGRRRFTSHPRSFFSLSSRTLSTPVAYDNPCYGYHELDDWGSSQTQMYIFTDSGNKLMELQSELSWRKCGATKRTNHSCYGLLHRNIKMHFWCMSGYNVPKV